MSLGESKGGLPPDSCCEDETACLADMRRCIEDFHDNSKCVMHGPLQHLCMFSVAAC